MCFAITVVLGSSLSPLTISRAEAQSASTYYVSPTGSDANSGSQSYPWATITRASSIVAPGDTVIVEDGTYHIPAGGSVGGSPAGDWAIGSNGTPGNPITYIARHKWQAKLVGQGTGDGSAIVGMHGGYNILENFDITGSDALGIMMATTGTTANHNQVIGNYVHDINAPCDGVGGGGINAGNGSDYTGIDHNDILGNLVINIINAGSSGCGFHTTYGIYEAVPYGTVANNIVINAYYAIQMWHFARNSTIFGNTTIRNANGIVIGASNGSTDDNTLVQNNVTVMNSSAGIIEEAATGIHNRYIDNLGYQNTVDISLQNRNSCSGCINGNPLFVSNTGNATGNYCLQSTSPARGTGLALAGIPTDFMAESRPQSGATVIGACIGSGTSSGTTPTGTVAAGITANPTSVAPGGSTTLTWTTKNAVSANLNGTSVPLNGSLVVYPTASTAYRVTAYSSTGTTDEGTVNVKVTLPVAAGITASPTSVTHGSGTTLTWTTKNAVSANLNGTSVPLSGSLVVYPTASTAYRITAYTSTGASDEGTVNVKVN